MSEVLKTDLNLQNQHGVLASGAVERRRTSRACAVQFYEHYGTVTNHTSLVYHHARVRKQFPSVSSKTTRV